MVCRLLFAHGRYFERDAWLVETIAALERSEVSATIDGTVFSSFGRSHECDGEVVAKRTWFEPISHGLGHPHALRKAASANTRPILPPYVQDWYAPSEQTRRYFSMIENMRSVTQVPHTRAWLCLDQALFDAHFRINMTSQLARHERERTCHNLVPHTDSSPILSINAPFIFKLSIERNMLMEKSHKRCCCCSPLSCQYSQKM